MPVLYLFFVSDSALISLNRVIHVHMIRLLLVRQLQASALSIVPDQQWYLSICCLSATTTQLVHVAKDLLVPGLCTSYTMGCPPVRRDNPRALASGLSYVQVDKHGITILYHLHQ